MVHEARAGALKNFIFEPLSCQLFAAPQQRKLCLRSISSLELILRRNGGQQSVTTNARRMTIFPHTPLSEHAR